MSKNKKYQFIEAVPYQQCPKCNGQGTVSKPPWLVGDIDQWTAAETSFICDVCNGTKIIPMHPLFGAAGARLRLPIEWILLM